MPGPYDPDDDPILREFEQRVLGEGALSESDRVYRSSTPTPAAPEEAPAEEVQKRAIANRAYQSVAPALGGSKGVYGFDADMFDPDERVKQAREAYRKLEPEEAPSRRWEQEFTSGRTRPTERDAERARIVNLWFHDFGNGQAADQAAERVRARRDQYDQGLAQALAADAATYEKNRRITPASADAVAATGLVSPEDAVKMTEGQAQAFLKSNVAALGARMRGQNLGGYKTELAQANERIKALEQAERGAAANESREKVAQIGADARVKAAGMRKGQGGAGGASASALNSPDVLAAYLHNARNVPRETAVAFANGTLDPSTVSKAMYDHLVSSAELYKALPAKQKAAMISTVERTDQAGIEKNVVASNDPRLIIKERGKFNALMSKFLPAYDAAKVLGPKLRVLAKYGLKGWSGQLADAQLNDQEQAAQASLFQILTEYAHAKFGAALTENETKQLAGATGFNMGENINYFASPARILQFLKNYQAELTRHEQLLDEQLGQGR